MNIQIVLKSDRICKSLTGLTVEEFRNLEGQFEWNLRECRIKLTPNRKRRIGGGRRGKIPQIFQKLFIVLMYLKCYPTYDVMAFITGLDRSRCCRWINILFSVLKQTLGRQLVLPQRQIRSVEEFIKLYPEVKDVFIDGTERRIQRPQNSKRRKKVYSGKAKATTRKNVIVIDEKRRVLYLTPTKSGRRHDKRVFDKYGAEYLPDNVTVWADTGFQGLQNVHTKSMIPKKRRKDRPLSEKEKAENKIISSLRMFSEHAIAGIKRMACVTHVYRNHKSNFDDFLILLSSGLWNYHLNFNKT